MHGQQIRLYTQHGDRHKIALGIKWQLGRQRGRHRQCSDGGMQQRVTVGRGVRRDLCADHRGSSTTIVDHHRLPQAFTQRVIDGARQHVVGASGWIRHD